MNKSYREYFSMPLGLSSTWVVDKGDVQAVIDKYIHPTRNNMLMIVSAIVEESNESKTTRTNRRPY